MNLVGSGVGAGSQNCGPLLGTVCEFSGLASDGPEAGGGSAAPELVGLVRLAMRGFVAR